MRFLSVLLVSFASMLLLNTTFAQSISVTRDIDFGLGVVVDNDAQHEIVIAPGGGFTSDPEFIFINQPLSGVYRLTGAAPSQTIDSVVITVDQQLLGGGQQFTIDNFSVNFPAQTDLAGEATITLGARLRTTGTGVFYVPSTVFSGLLTMEVTLL